MDIENEETTPKDKKEFYGFYDIARRMMLAGIGAVALKHDEIEEFIDKLVERGELARKDGEELMKEMRERHKKHSEGEGRHKHMAEFMDRFTVPTRKDFDELYEKLAALEKKIDELNKSKE